MARPGDYRGRHYTEWVGTVKALKREGDFEAALKLLEGLMSAVEAEYRVDRLAPAPWYFEQAGIIHRKLHNNDDEVAVLERYLRITPDMDAERIVTRLAKARQLAAKARSGPSRRP